MNMPQLINLDDSFQSFLKEIPDQVHKPFNVTIPNGVILEDIVTRLMQKPKQNEDPKIYINDKGYDNIGTIDSILGVSFRMNKDFEELLQEQTIIVMNQFQKNIPNEKESQSTSIVNVQINELESQKVNLQKEIANLTILQKSIYKQDVRQEFIEQLLEQKKINIRLSQQSINLFHDQLMFRQTFEQYNSYLKELIYSVLKLEVTLSFRTQRLRKELEQSQNEREKQLQKKNQQLKSEIKEKEDELKDLTDKIQFNFNHYQQLEEQIEQAKQHIQKQLLQIKQQKVEKEEKQQKTSSPSVMSASKSNISDLEILKQQTRKVSNSYAHRNRFKTIFFKR